MLDITFINCFYGLVYTTAGLFKRTPDAAVLECRVTTNALAGNRFLWYLNEMDILSRNAREHAFNVSGNTITIRLDSSEVFGNYSCLLAGDITSYCQQPYTLGKVRYIVEGNNC